MKKVLILLILVTSCGKTEEILVETVTCENRYYGKLCKSSICTLDGHKVNNHMCEGIK